ncbi:cullin, ubiquitin ligase activity [Scheffersomyces stipitis CBS 6054]|uniref:Cullin, ubiquitin ligase activity n=1 Tax=Scheffersomyces stipitis (strain ATCC 58785 / CBS 6054 / NBRC 10063 / NRRL Y-11545) TaxID=322104 RepID=A3GFR1_PICST|nr:cullin, ubiquitin ligase activity [Scheffersomyces stipitis CBS 6054]EAZ63396.2 cullin, ubiquitin ligase activity [Scheffersomyces stipitis CBS 6054]
MLDFGNLEASSSSLSTRDAGPSHLTPQFQRSSDSSDTNTSNTHKRIKPNFEPPTKPQVLESLQVAKSAAEEVIDLVLEGKPLKRSYYTYYKDIESICRYKHAEKSKLASLVFEKLDNAYKVVKQKTTSRNIRDNISDSEPYKWTNAFLAIIQDWKDKLSRLSKLFAYLDRGYLLPHATKKTILEYGLGVYVEDILANMKEDSKNEISELVLKRYLLQLRYDQSVLHIYSESSEAFTRTLMRLNFNNDYSLHKNLSDDIAEHYRSISRKWHNDPDYLDRVCSILKGEVDFFRDCGQSQEFLDTLYKSLKFVLIFYDHSEIFVEVLPGLLESENGPRQLQTLYKFCEQSLNDFALDSMPMFRTQWGAYVEKKVMEVIETSKTAGSGSNVLSLLVDIFVKYDTLSNSYLDEKFEFELRNYFKKGLNDRTNSSFIVYQLCKYCDSYFKGPSKKSSLPETFEEFKKNVLIIFKAIENKRDFTEIYQKDLSKRLLVSRNTNFDHEKELADSLLEVIGESDESVGLQVMFKDLNQSKDVYSSLIESTGIEFNPLVLEKKYWPDIPKMDTDITLPSELQLLLDQFTAKYTSSGERFKSQKLDWSNYTLHQLSINAEFESGTKELVVNLLQAVVILVFNDVNSYTFVELQQLTGMEPKLLKRVLGSVSSEKYAILSRDGDIYSFNSKFTDKSSRIKIPLSKDKDSMKISASVSESDTNRIISRNRTDELKGAIVKVMKEFKQLSVTELLNKAIEGVEKRGPVTLTELKKNIDDLVDSEYLRRVDRETLAYIP